MVNDDTADFLVKGWRLGWGLVKGWGDNRRTSNG